MDNPVETPLPLNELWLQIGQKLRAARLEQKIAISDVAEYLKISIRKVEAIEDANLEQLPALAFTKGFIRSYAKLLKLDLNELLAKIPMQVNLEPHRDSRVYQRKIVRPHHKASSSRFLRKWALAMLLGVLLALSLMALKFFKLTEKSAEIVPVIATPVVVNKVDTIALVSSAASSNKAIATAPMAPAKSPLITVAKPDLPVISPVPTPSNVANTTDAHLASIKAKLFIHAESDTWLQVLNKNGKIVFDQSYQSGQKGDVNIDLPAQIIVGDVRAVQLSYQGKRLRLANTHGIGFVEIKE